ncbi:MAG TPA: hypothetical protein VKC66_21655 [Xanthobacteraceae bacterium]|nr:hypothetical protein [Xanthobacteraceae bacterium]
MRTFVFFVLLLIPSLVMAQSKPGLPDPLRVAAELGGAIPKRGAALAASPDDLWRKVQAANAADLRYAKALADSVGSPGAKLRSACYGAWIATIEQTQGVGLKDASGNAVKQPEPHVFSSFEQLAEVAETLQPTGPLMAACAPAWTALKLSAIQFFTMVASGAAGLSALGIAIP